MKKRKMNKPIGSGNVAKPTLSKFDKWFRAMKKIIKNTNTVVLTDQELWLYVNEQLPIRNRISLSTFDKWKAGGVENNRSITALQAIDFRHVMGFARVKQKLALTDDMLNVENKQAYKQQWLIERKFEDMKAAPQIEINQKPVILIEPKDDGQAERIKRLLGDGKTTEVIDIEHKEVD